MFSLVYLMRIAPLVPGIAPIQIKKAEVTKE
jgi:hypothetical protein